MASDDLINLVRAQRNPALASVDATYLAILITAASTQIQGWLNRCLVSQTFTEKRDGEGYQTLFLPNYPVTGITQLDFIEPDAIVTAVMPNGADVTKYFFLGDGGEIDFIINNPSGFEHFPRGFKNISIIYTAGLSPIPEDIQEATTEQIVFLVQEGSTASNIASQKLGDYAISFNTSSGSSNNFSTTAFQMLAKYKRRLV